MISHNEINLTEVTNSDELADALKTIKEQVKEDRADLDKKFVVLGLICFVVIGAIYFVVNYKALKSDRSRRILCIISVLVSVVIAIGLITLFRKVL